MIVGIGVCVSFTGWFHLLLRDTKAMVVSLSWAAAAAIPGRFFESPGLQAEERGVVIAMLPRSRQRIVWMKRCQLCRGDRQRLSG